MGFASGLLYATFNLLVFFSLMAFGGGRSEAFIVGLYMSSDGAFRVVSFSVLVLNLVLFICIH